MFEEELSGKQRYIVTFKKKDARADREKDKTEIFQESVTAKLNFIDVGASTAGFVPPDDPEGLVALDINDFETPMVFAALTDGESGALSNDPNVESVELDGMIYASDFSFFEMLPENGLFDQFSGSAPQTAVGGPSAQADAVTWGISRVKAPMCWEATKGKGIYVAVLDTGVWPHNDLKGNLLGGISFVPGESWIDGNGHGTHVAGTIAARMNGSGVVGVAPSAYVYAIKVLNNSGSGHWSWLMAGLHWMRKYHGCTFDVANMSLGASSAPKALEAYINYAAEKTLLVAAAGNYHPSNANKPVGYPAKYNKCLAVSAIASNNDIAGFSGRGPEVDLCAPGVNIVSTLPGNSYGSLSGTSMAAPHVAGAAALCRGTHRYSDMDHIKKILLITADDLGVPGKDDEFGYGRVDCNGAAFKKSCG
jgi:subtilisin